MSEETFGSAFPSESHFSDGTPNGFDPGMTLRDYFAAAALQGISSHVGGPLKKGNETNAEAHARWSYDVANAMIKERAK